MANKDLVSLQFPGLNDTYIIPKDTVWFTYGTQSATLSAEIEAAYQAKKTVLVERNGGVFALSYRATSTSHLFCCVDDSYVTTFTVSNNSWGTVFPLAIPYPANATPSDLGTAAIGTSSRYAKADHVHNMPSASDVGALPHTTTLTIATTDWSSLSCTKTVSGMTSTAVVWLEYSDTTTVFTCTQGTDSLTFGCDATPSAAVTVKVAFMEAAT